jgi:hypothetical protein
MQVMGPLKGAATVASHPVKPPPAYAPPFLVAWSIKSHRYAAVPGRKGHGERGAGGALSKNGEGGGSCCSGCTERVDGEAGGGEARLVEGGGRGDAFRFKFRLMGSSVVGPSKVMNSVETVKSQLLGLQ